MPLTSNTRACWLAAVLALYIPGAGAAPPAVDAVMERGAQLLDGGKPEAAGNHFAAAFAELDEPEFLFNAGFCFEEAKKLVLAHHYYSRFLLEVASEHQSAEMAKARLEGLNKQLLGGHTRIHLISSPVGAHVEVPGYPHPLSLPSWVWLPHGRHRLQANLGGREPRDEEVIVDAAGPSAIRFELGKMLPGRLRVVTAPAGASVKVNGVLRGPSPVELVLEAGEYTVEASLPGFRPQRATVSIEADRYLTHSLALSELAAAPVVPVETIDEHKPLVEQWWLWTIVGAVVVGGVTTGLVLGLSEDEPGAPTPSLGTWSSEGLR